MLPQSTVATALIFNWVDDLDWVWNLLHHGHGIRLRDNERYCVVVTVMAVVVVSVVSVIMVAVVVVMMDVLVVVVVTPAFLAAVAVIAGRGQTSHGQQCYCNTLQHIASHCHLIQHTATHFNTLKHIATHRNTQTIHIY